jgi:hypothetical protein
MHKLVPVLIGLAASIFFVARGAMNWPNPLENGPAAASTTAVSDQRQDAIDPTQAVVSFLADVDDLLDTIHDSRSFATARPKLLKRARQQAALAAQHPNQGMTQLSREDARKWQQAANRHTESLARAMAAVPAVEDFFMDELAEILSPDE